LLDTTLDPGMQAVRGKGHKNLPVRGDGPESKLFGLVNYTLLSFNRLKFLKKSSLHKSISRNSLIYFLKTKCCLLRWVDRPSWISAPLLRPAGTSFAGMTIVVSPEQESPDQSLTVSIRKLPLPRQNSTSRF